MSSRRAAHRFDGGTVDEPRDRDVVQQGFSAMLLEAEDRSTVPMCVASGRRAVVLIAALPARVASLVRRPSRPKTSMGTSLEEATLALDSIQDALEASLRDLDATQWDELSQQLDHVNELLRSVVDDVAGRRAPPGEHG